MYKVVLLIENSRGFGRDLLKGIAQYSRLHGPWTFYRMPPFYLASGCRIPEKELRRMKNWGATGIIMREVRNNSELLKLGLPTVASTYAQKKIPGAAEIYVDNKGIGRMAAEHLLEIGFTRFAFCGYNGFFWSQERQDGFAERIKEAGFDTIIYKQPKSKTQQLWDNEQVILAQWLKSLPKPIGLMACIDERSQDVLEACKIADIPVPEAIALIGGDNDELICNLSNPPLSSVAISGVQAGYQAAELLHNMMAGKIKKADQQITVRPNYVEIRQSTDVTLIDDKYVAEAIRFIRQNTQEPIQVTDVARAAGLGRRSLEKHFRNTLGHSIYNEIMRVRIEQVTKLLLSTNLSISAIADKLGFTSVNNIARLFRKEKGMTLLAYRKQYQTLSENKHHVPGMEMPF